MQALVLMFSISEDSLHVCSFRKMELFWEKVVLCGHQRFLWKYVGYRQCWGLGFCGDLCLWESGESSEWDSFKAETASHYARSLQGQLHADLLGIYDWLLEHLKPRKSYQGILLFNTAPEQISLLQRRDLRKQRKHPQKRPNLDVENSWRWIWKRQASNVGGISISGGGQGWKVEGVMIYWSNTASFR